jgi:hypothetical protein
VFVHVVSTTLSHLFRLVNSSSSIKTALRNAASAIYILGRAFSTLRPSFPRDSSVDQVGALQ